MGMPASPGVPASSAGNVLWYNKIGMKSQPIEQIRKRFHREWLLIAVDKLNPRTQEPLRGRLLAHSPRRNEIYERMVKAEGLTFTLYSEKSLPQGYAIAFLRA